MMTATPWKCDLCGYVHNGSQPPEACPVCGADATHFSELVIPAVHAAAPSASAWQCSICDHIVQGHAPPEFCPVCGAATALFHPYQAEAAEPVAAEVRRIVILGGGIAGLTAAEEARRRAKEVDITLVSREPTLPYFRLNLTRFLAGEVKEADLLIQHRDWFASERIEHHIGDAVAIDRDNRQVVLRDGGRCGYDRLILANGSHPFIPPIPGVNREGVHVLRTLDNARVLQQQLRPGLRVVCVGGGLLGLETAWALQRQGAQVTVLEGFGWLLPRQLPEAAANLLARHLETQGMTVRCQAQVKEFTGDETVGGVLLADGTELVADLVVLATGVRPNSHLARQCGLKVGQGVVVDDCLRTSDRQILAAGDVSEHRGRVYGIWPASYAQGVVAGANAVGGSAEFTGVPMTNRIKVLDVELFSIGEIQPRDASSRLIAVEQNGSYRGLCCHDGRVIGGVLYGDMTLMGALRDAVEQGLQLPELGNLAGAFPGLG